MCLNLVSPRRCRTTVSVLITVHLTGSHAPYLYCKQGLKYCCAARSRCLSSDSRYSKMLTPAGYAPRWRHRSGFAAPFHFWSLHCELYGVLAKRTSTVDCTNSVHATCGFDAGCSVIGRLTLTQTIQRKLIKKKKLYSFQVVVRAVTPIKPQNFWSIDQTNELLGS